mgnify:CR=1 FL=1
MKIEKFIVISAILILAMTNYAYGWGSHGGHHHRQYYSGNNTTTDNSGESGTVQAIGLTESSVPVSVPEPVTIVLLGAGLIGLAAGLARKKFKRHCGV